MATKRAFWIAFTLVVSILLPVQLRSASADITCLNSDYNCIYVVDGSRIVCSRSFCGGDPSQYEVATGKKAVLEGPYAFDGANPNVVTTTTSFTTSTIAGGSGSTPGTLSLTVSGGYPFTTTRWGSGSGVCFWTYALYLDVGLTQSWNAVWTAQSISCYGNQDWSWSNLNVGATYYFRQTFIDGSGSIDVIHSFTVPAPTTTTVDPTIPTTTTIPLWSPSQVSPDNPCLQHGYACGWAMVAPNGIVGGVIVCTIEVCGPSGEFHGVIPGTDTRLILQSQQMEGGNVAGWSGGTYKPETNTFDTGSGTLAGGAKLEDIVYPTSTSIKPIDLAEVGAITDEGTVYETVSEYVKDESVVIANSSSISIEMPFLPYDSIQYTITFDPVGSAGGYVVARGSIEQGGIETLSTSTQKSLSKSKFVIPRKFLSGKTGLLKLSLRAGSKSIGQVSVIILSIKTYKSCMALRRDYPGGVSASRSAIDRKSSKDLQSKSLKPTIYTLVFLNNQKLDSDKDRIICEASG